MNWLLGSSRLRAAVCWNFTSFTSFWLWAAAAFGRLCVETLFATPEFYQYGAAAFGRLCVETVAFFDLRFNCCAAAFGRLCVETAAFWWFKRCEGQPPSGGCVLKQQIRLARSSILLGSRLRAAVCWNLGSWSCRSNHSTQPPSGGCVLKRQSHHIDLFSQRSHLRVAVCWNNH